MRYPLGQPVRVYATVTNADGVTTSDFSTLTLTVQTWNADGTTTVTGTYSSPVEDSIGNYHQDVPATDLTSIGHYQYTWVTTGDTIGVSYGDFDVFDPFEVRVLSLQDAKVMLNIPLTDTTNDAELDSWIATIESSLERMTGGPMVNTQITERCEVTSGYTVFTVRQRPLVSVQAIVSASSLEPLSIVDVTDLDPNAGTIRRRLGLPFIGPYFSWLPIFNITYTAGWGVTVPAAFASAARIIVRHMWDTQRGVTAAPMLGGDETATIPGFGFAIPARAIELLDGSMGGIPFMQEVFV